MTRQDVSNFNGPRAALLSGECHYFNNGMELDRVGTPPRPMRPARLERATYGLGNHRSIQLSYGRSSPVHYPTRHSAANFDVRTKRKGPPSETEALVLLHCQGRLTSAGP